MMESIRDYLYSKINDKQNLLHQFKKDPLFEDTAAKLRIEINLLYDLYSGISSIIEKKQ